MANEEFSIIRRVLWAVGVLGLAIVGVFVIGRNAPAAALPEYELALVGGDQTTYGAPVQLRADTIRVRASTRVQIVARPAMKPEGAVAARAFLIDGGAARAWSAPVEIGEDGSARIAGDAGAIFPAPSGDWDVVVAIGRPNALPTESSVVGLLTSPMPTVKIIRAHVVVRGDT
jgi:hypothetical protein